MCLIAVDWSPGSDTPLTLIANRDEYFARPTAPLYWWEGAKVLAGQDLKDGGTWLGVTVSGRMAAITNYRAPHRFDPSRASRGDVVSRYLRGSMTPMAYCDQLKTQAHMYNDFNLLLYDGKSLLGFESRHRKVIVPTTGVFALSNADFDTPWLKALTLKARLRKSLLKYESLQPSEDELLDLLSDQTVAQDELLPATGIPLDRERALSAAFIRATDYGTRASSLVRFWRRRVTFVERRFDASGQFGESKFTFDVLV